MFQVEANSILSIFFRASRSSASGGSLSGPRLAQYSELAFEIAVFEFLTDTLNICIE
jgi:hypothetical protein